MSQPTLQDLLDKIKATQQETIDRVGAGERPPSPWDGPPMPCEFEYRAKVIKGEYKPSNAGNLQFVITYEIQEPTAYAGRTVQDYKNPVPTNEAGSVALASFFGAFHANLEGWGDDFEGFVQQFVDQSAVITLRTWGEENDRYGVRWINADRGQELSTKIKPETAKKQKADLKADVVVPKKEEAEGETQAAPKAASGINLPPGLRA